MATSPAGYGGDHEAKCHEQAETDAHHEVEGKTLWIGCVGRGTIDEFGMIFSVVKSNRNKSMFILLNRYYLDELYIYKK